MVAGERTEDDVVRRESRSIRMNIGQSGGRPGEDRSDTPQREHGNEGGTDGGERANREKESAKVADYCCNTPRVFDKLPQKGKNKQSCTVLF